MDEKGLKINNKSEKMAQKLKNFEPFEPNEKIICNECKKEFLNKQYLDKHIKLYCKKSNKYINIYKFDTKILVNIVSQTLLKREIFI